MGAVKFSRLSSHEIYSLNWKGIDQKLSGSDGSWFMVGLCSQVSVQLDFWESQVFGKVSLFTVKYFVWLYAFLSSMQWFSLKKNIDKLAQDQFLQPVKEHLYNKFGYVGKIMAWFFSSLIKHNLVIKNSRNCVQAY